MRGQWRRSCVYVSTMQLVYRVWFKTHSRYGNTTLFLKVLATQMRFSGS